MKDGVEGEGGRDEDHGHDNYHKRQLRVDEVEASLLEKSQRSRLGYKVAQDFTSVGLNKSAC